MEERNEICGKAVWKSQRPREEALAEAAKKVAALLEESETTFNEVERVFSMAKWFLSVKYRCDQS